MKNLHYKQRGITMMEVMVAIVIVAIMAGIAIPSFSTMIDNAQVRSTAESVQAGLQLTRGEAVRQNDRAQFLLTRNPDNSANWVIVAASSSVPGSFLASDGAITVQSAVAAEMGIGARLNVTADVQAVSGCCSVPLTTGMAATDSVVLDAFGKVVAQTFTRIDIIKPGDTDANDQQRSRRRVILISKAGAPRLCRPSLPASNPQGCP